MVRFVGVGEISTVVAVGLGVFTAGCGSPPPPTDVMVTSGRVAVETAWLPGAAFAVAVICAGDTRLREQASGASHQASKTIRVAARLLALPADRWLSADLVFRMASLHGFYSHPISYQEAVVFDSIALGKPTFQVKGDLPISGDPFPVIPAGEMQMGSV